MIFVNGEDDNFVVGQSVRFDGFGKRNDGQLLAVECFVVDGTKLDAFLLRPGFGKFCLKSRRGHVEPRGGSNDVASWSLTNLDSCSFWNAALLVQ